MDNHLISDAEISSRLLLVFQSGMYSLGQLCGYTGLEFHRINQIMRDGSLEKLNDEEKEKLIKFIQP